MKYLIALLLTVFYLSSQSQILAGYIRVAPAGSSDSACRVSGGMTLAAYTSDGTFTSGRAITNSSGGTLSPAVNDYDFHPYSATANGTVAGWVQIWGDNTSHGTGTCSGGGGGGGGSNVVDTLVGYATSTNYSSNYNACAGSTDTVRIYIRKDSIIARGGLIIKVNDIIYTDNPGNTTLNSGFLFYGVSSSFNGSTTQYIQTTGSGVVNAVGSCSGLGGGGGSGPATIPWDTTGYLYPDAYPLMASDGRGSYSYPFETLFAGVANAGGLMRVGVVNRFHRKGFQGISNSYYPGNKGVGYILDLVKDTNMTDFSKKDTINKIGWREENVFNPKDTIYFYAIDSILQLSNKAQAITCLARADSLLTPFAALPFSNRSTWDSVTVANKAVRYVLVRFPTHDSTATLQIWTFAQPGALKIGGKRYTAGPVTTYQSISTAAKGVTTMDSLIGRNQSETIDDTLSYAENHIRFYTKSYYWDSSHVALGSSLKFTMNYFNDAGYIENYLKRKKAAGNFVWVSIRGASTYLNSRAPSGESTENAIPVSDWGQDPELLSSYGRYAMMTKELARKFGSGSTADSSHFNNAETVFQGLNKNSMDAIEVGNETEADFNGSCSALAYYCWVKNTRDSVDLVDPSFKLIGNGTYFLNQAWYKSYWLFTQFFNNKNFMLYAVNFHDYTSRMDSIYLNPIGQLSYHKGATPEWDSCYQRYQSYTNFFKQRIPNVKVFNTEYGLEEGDSAAVINSPFQTAYSTNTIQGVSIGNSRFGMLLRRELINAASNLHKSTLYTSVNPVYIDFTKYTTGTQNVATFAQMGVMAGDGSPGGGQHGAYKVPAYYLHGFIKKYLTGYKVETVTNIGRDNLCLIKFRNVNAGKTDSVAYACWWGIDSVNSTHPYNILTAGMIGTPKKVVPTMGLTDAGTESSASISGNYITATADWLPQLFFSKEGIAGDVNGPDNNKTTRYSRKPVKK